DPGGSDLSTLTSSLEKTQGLEDRKNRDGPFFRRMAPLRNIKIDATFPTMEIKGELMKTAVPSTSRPAKTSALSTPPKIPKAVLQACKKLSTEGFKAWLAGGCVRDAILNRKPKDWDIVTNAPLEKIREFFPDHLEVGAVFGIVKLPQSGTKADPVNIDI